MCLEETEDYQNLSEAYRRAMADAKQRSANVSNFFQPLTNLIYKSL